MTHDCRQLDDFLDGLLSGEDCSLFAAHVEDCSPCRAAVEFDRQVRASLQPVADEDGAPRLVQRAVERVRTNRRRRIAGALGATAAGLGLALLVGRLWQGPHIEPAPVAVVDPVVVEPSPEPEMEHAVPDDAVVIDLAQLEENKARIEMLPTPGQQYMAVPQPTRNRDVTFVMLYPLAGGGER